MDTIFVLLGNIIFIGMELLIERLNFEFKIFLHQK